MRKLTGEKLEAELARLEGMRAYEHQYESAGIVCGIDEAGRGPLAGPVVAAVAVLPKDCTILRLNDSKKLSEKQIKIIKGDAKSVSIAAASILAKVTRDHMMMEYDKIYPEYGFAKHKGYGTKMHNEAILTYGPCPIHRRTFLKKLLGEEAAMQGMK